MKVLVTGASGFVGSHTVKAILDAGHEVRASARERGRVQRALAPLGCADAAEVVEADVTEPAAVGAALEGCDAVVHAAAIYSHDVRQGAAILAQNPRAAEVVLGTACERGLDPVIHISSYVALLPAEGTLTADSPVGRPRGPYALSKARSEEVARRLQGEGKPVTIVQPGMVWGPHDPAANDSIRFARDLLDGRVPAKMPGAVLVVDVRDVARVNARALRPGAGPRRYLAASELMPIAEVMRVVCEAAGVRTPRGTLPGPLITAISLAADRLQRLSRKRLPIDHQSIWTVLHGVPADTSAARDELGIEFRAAAESLRDTVRWLQATAT